VNHCTLNNLRKHPERILNSRHVFALIRFVGTERAVDIINSVRNFALLKNFMKEKQSNLLERFKERFKKKGFDEQRPFVFTVHISSNEATEFAKRRKEQSWNSQNYKDTWELKAQEAEITKELNNLKNEIKEQLPLGETIQQDIKSAT